MASRRVEVSSWDPSAMTVHRFTRFLIRPFSDYSYLKTRENRHFV